jgi:small subunit ribosomal protein S16
MAVKLRLQRHGRKRKPFYHIVVADARAPRDGKFIEKVGVYNPNTNPATIELALDKAVNWLEKGAQPTDTVRAILSYKGALYRKHLNTGIRKGVITEEQADKQFNDWMAQKAGLVDQKVDRLSKERADLMSARLKQETLKKEAIAAKVLAKNTPDADEAVAETEEVAEDAVVEETTAAETTETVEETVAEETPVAETTEVVEETVTEETTPEVEKVAETEETPAAEEEPTEEDNKEKE